MTQIDLSNAPEGATHYGPAVQHLVANWFQFDGADYFLWDGRCWMKMSNGIQPLRKETLIALPTWNGSGLPPVGTVCEVEHCGKWIKCEIIAHFQQESAQVAAFIFSPYSGNPKLKELAYYIVDSFRPTRTPEQIAADERLHAVRNALTTIKASRSFPGDVARQNVMVATVEAMIGAGYRKVEVKP